MLGEGMVTYWIALGAIGLFLAVSYLLKEQERLKEQVDDVYMERNDMVFAFMALAEREGLDIGWNRDEETTGWAVVWVDDEDVGQMGWHVPVGRVPDWIPNVEIGYDGHSTAQKYDRMWRLIDRWQGD